VDFEKLTKLMMMTTSNQDGEALNALRMANKILLQEKKNWADVLQKTPPDKRHYPTYQPPTKNKRIAEMFELLKKEKRINQGTRQFIDDIELKFSLYGELTPKQKSAIEKIFFRYYNEEK
jgi:hypothetical protein